MMFDIEKEVDIMMDIIEKVNDLICVPTDEQQLLSNLKLLFTFYSNMSDDDMRRIFERKVYTLYGAILEDNLLSISSENEIEDLLIDLELPTFEEYINNKKLTRTPLS